MILNRHEYTTEIGKQLKRRRRSLGLSLKELSSDAGTNLSYLAKIERGETTPSIYLYYRIDLALEAREQKEICEKLTHGSSVSMLPVQLG